MAERVCRICTLSDYRNLELTDDYGSFLRETFNIDISGGNMLCIECWNSVARMRTLKLMAEQSLVIVSDHDEKCATCNVPVLPGVHHLNLTENLVLWLKNSLNIEFTTDNQLCRECWNMVVKSHQLQLMIKQPHGTQYGHWTQLMCRFCQNVGNHEKLTRDLVLLLTEILDIDFSSNDLVCAVCLHSVARLKNLNGLRAKEEPPSTDRPVGFVVPLLDDNNGPISPIGSFDRFLVNIPTPMLSELSSFAASPSEASSVVAPSDATSSSEASPVSALSDDMPSNVTSTTSRSVRRKKKLKANSLYKQSLLNMLKKATK